MVITRSGRTPVGAGSTCRPELWLTIQPLTDLAKIAWGASEETLCAVAAAEAKQGLEMAQLRAQFGDDHALPRHGKSSTDTDEGRGCAEAPFRSEEADDLPLLRPDLPPHPSSPFKQAPHPGHKLDRVRSASPRTRPRRP